jgi:hypothetical protein
VIWSYQFSSGSRVCVGWFIVIGVGYRHGRPTFLVGKNLRSLVRLGSNCGEEEGVSIYCRGSFGRLVIRSGWLQMLGIVEGGGVLLNPRGSPYSQECINHRYESNNKGSGDNSYFKGFKSSAKFERLFRRLEALERWRELAVRPSPEDCDPDEQSLLQEEFDD